MRSALTEQHDTNHRYEIEEFHNHPGVYFEKIGQLQQVTKTWKIVTKLDITALNDKTWQINKYTQQTYETCEQIKSDDHNKRTCDNLKEIVKNESKQLAKLITLINTLYKTRTNKRRGLVDGIGSIAKTLFGTMDANDRELINEQLNLLQNKQQTLQHVTKNQIKVLNSTIVHLDKLENILDHNGKLLNHYVREYYTREEITEHFTVITAMITDLIRDAKDVIEYLTYASKGIMHPLLTPISDIITHLKEAALQLPQGLYFPFEIRSEEWLEIAKYIKLNIYREGPVIITIMRFPLIAQPIYDIINVIPLPTYDSKNIFTQVEIRNELIALDKEGLTYIEIKEKELDKCIQIKNKYVCEKTHPIHRLNSHTPCEVQMYLQHQHESCNTRHIIVTNTIWIPLRQPLTWLYSTINEQPITIQCEDHNEIRKIVKKTGQIRIGNKCKIKTTEITIQPKEAIQNDDSIETYLPEANLTLLRDDTNTLDEKQQNILQHQSELVELRNKLKDMNKDLQNNENKFYTKKQFVYPMATSGILITVITIAIIIYIVLRKRNKQKPLRRPSVSFFEDDFRIPRSILRRSQSTRF